MRPDFSLIWGADNAPFTPIEASDYTAGWVFRTGAPPRRVNFDYFQNLSDERTAWLGEQMLLAVGHEWQDDVTYDAYAVVRSPVNGQLYRSLAGGNLGNEPSVSGAQWALGVQPLSVDFLNTTRIDVASAATVNLTSSAPNTRHINITGTTAITGFTVAAGQCYFVRFAGALTLTNSAALVTQTGADIATMAGDTCVIRATAANTVEILFFVRGAVSQSKSANGYRVLHDGSANPVIIQWGTCTFNASGVAAVSFPIAFPNNAFSITANADANNSLSFVESVSYASLTTTGVTLSCGSGASVASGTGRYMAIGN